MLFNSISFAIFLPIVFCIYWLVPARYRWGVILLSSYYFYMSWDVKYVTLILFTTAISYICGLILRKTQSVKVRKCCVAATLVISLGVLFVFKYFNFFSDSFAALMHSVGIAVSPVTLNVLLPVGISFYTFQTLSYVIDVYRGEVEAQRHFGKYAAFISFFPSWLRALLNAPETCSRRLSSPVRSAAKRRATD